MKTLLERSLDKINGDLLEAFTLCQNNMQIFSKNKNNKKNDEIIRNNIKQIKKLNSSISRLNLKVLALYSPNSTSLTEVYLYIRINTILSLLSANIKNVISKCKNNINDLLENNEFIDVLSRNIDILKKTSKEVLNFKNSKEVNTADKSIILLAKENKKHRIKICNTLLKNKKNKTLKVILAIELIEEIENKCIEISHIIRKNTKRL